MYVFFVAAGTYVTNTPGNKERFTVKRALVAALIAQIIVGFSSLSVFLVDSRACVIN